MSDTDPATLKLAEALQQVLARPQAAPAEVPASPSAPAAPPAAQVPAPAAAPEIPSTPVPAAAVAAATPAPGQLPEGILSLEELRRQERDGGSGERGMTHAERMRANDVFCESAAWHARNGAS